MSKQKSEQGLRWTQDDLTKIMFALPADEWIILVKLEDGGEFLHDIISKHQLISRKYVGMFRARNANGCHVYGRPNSTRYILIDDVSETSIQRMKEDGLVPTVVVETSPDNFQIWITVSKEDLTISTASRLAVLLERRYSHDTGSADALHLGQLPGLRNKKPKYRTRPKDGGPKVRLRIASQTVKITLFADEMIEQLESQDTQSPPRPSTPIGGGVLPIHSTTDIDIDPSRSPMTPVEAYEIYEAEVQCQAERKGWSLPIQKGFRSDADYAVIYSLRKYYGYDPDDLAALLTYGSEKAEERGMEYIIRTVSNVCHHNNQSTHSL